MSLINCARCNRLYHDDPDATSLLGNRLLCSTECEKKKKYATCTSCSKEFIMPAGRSRRTCSDECARQKRINLGKMCS